MQRIMIRCLLLLWFISFAGCSYPTFINPIVKPAEAERFEELFGVYLSKDPETGEILWLHIGRCAKSLPKGFHKFVLISPPASKKTDQGLTVAEYVGFVFKKGASYIVQMPCTDKSGDDQASVIIEAWGKSEIDGYTVVRLKRVGDQLQLDLLNEERIEEHVQKKNLSGRIEQNTDESTEPPTVGKKNIIVTAESDELRRFFESENHESLFDSSGFIFTKHTAQ